jgi:hypothetical protein
MDVNVLCKLKNGIHVLTAAVYANARACVCVYVHEGVVSAFTSSVVPSFLVFPH